MNAPQIIAALILGAIIAFIGAFLAVEYDAKKPFHPYGLFAVCVFAVGFIIFGFAAGDLAELMK